MSNRTLRIVISRKVIRRGWMIVVKSAGTERCSALFTDAFQPHEIERPEFVANLSPGD
jgi:hypothetical protein